MKKLELRSRDLVGRAGVGAIVEIGRQSFVTTDIAHWGGGDYGGQPIHHDRLCVRLGVLQLRSARNAGAKGPTLVRFPAWMFCELCGALNQHGQGRLVGREPKCTECPGHLIGMRWVAACVNGHLFDVPWYDWAHLNNSRRQIRDPQCRRRRGLRLKSLSGGTASHGSLIVECRDCGAASSLQGLPGKGTLAKVGLEQCPGTQPWYEPQRREPCTADPEVLMRASSRLHFPRTVSMLEIPPEADRKPDLELRQRLKNEIRAITWSIYKARREAGEPNTDLRAYADHLGCSVGDIEAILDEDIGRSAGEQGPQRGPMKVEDPADEQAVLAEEWAALMSNRPDQPAWSRFLTEQGDPRALGSPMADVIDRLVLVHRVREVRAYYGYRRMSGDSSKSRRVGAARTLDDERLATSWLPGHEVLGEGVFINVRTDALERWASGEVNATRASELQARLAKSYLSRGIDSATTSHPWFVPLHTLSHLLIREMAFSAGYSTASLRERIYVGPAAGGRTASGILIYTAEGDSEGTLGGLVRIGEPGRMRPVIESLLTHAQWCGQDPICRESTGQGMLSLNRAACHGCCLLPETSCVHVNVMLDRNSIVSLGAGGTGLLGA